MRSNSSAPATQKSHANATATPGLMGRFQFLRRKTVDQLRIRQPLMEEGGCAGDGGAEACNWNSHRKNATENVTALAENATTAATTTTTEAANNSVLAAATTTSNYYNNNSNNRNSSSGSYSIDGSSAEGSNRAGGILLVTTTAVHTNPNTCTYNNNLHLDGNKIADEAL